MSQEIMGDIFTKKVASEDVDSLHKAALLVMLRTDLPNGSSFALTTDRHSGVRVLWLTDASFEYLKVQAPRLFV